MHPLDPSIKTGIGWFDAPYVRAMLDAESPERMRDIEGPQSDELILHAGWSFTEEPLHVALVPDLAAALAVAWIAATTRGLNLTYAVAHSAEGKGLATFLTAYAVVIYSQQRASSASQAGLTVHAQFDRANEASANVAAHLGFVTEPSLSFTVANGNGCRLFVGSEASWLSVLTKAKNVVSQLPREPSRGRALGWSA